ncbi:hypothetical protein MTY59_32600 [Mycobacterium senriense]|uniref:Uncharacterized protein n=1 Tax=Mycobacterium senriense TaxID=2775496 RepID=A0ABN6IHY8_9MYCO|nr:hypothetical protein MTY59_32600 [Mycobacterium senriense]
MHNMRSPQTVFTLAPSLSDSDNGLSMRRAVRDCPTNSKSWQTSIEQLCPASAIEDHFRGNHIGGRCCGLIGCVDPSDLPAVRAMEGPILLLGDDLADQSCGVGVIEAM